MNKVHDEVVNDLQNLLTLLQKEKQHEYAYYSQYLTRLPVSQKVKEGVCWYPVVVKETGFGLGDYPYVKLENLSKTQEHQFSAGKTVKFYNPQEPEEFLNGNIYYVDGKTMKIVFIIDELPEWADKGKLAVDILFDDRSYQEMEKALKTVMNAKNCRLAELANILFGQTPAAKIPVQGYYGDELLNASQNQAVNAILQTEDVAFIHGPPGTGKTTTLVAAIHEMVKQGGQVLVCTPSNASADHIAMELGHKDIRVIRIGNISRVSDELLKYTVEGLLENHNQYKTQQEYKWKSHEYRRLASKYKRNFGPEERKQRDLLYKEARSLGAEARLLEDFMVDDILRMGQVIVTTLVGVSNRYLEKRTFKTLIIDEAAQALEPAAWIPICRAEKVIMAGDPFQLPPTVKNLEAAKEGLSITLMERSMKILPDQAFLLNIQYRMNEEIMTFSNQYFYEGKLQAHDSVKQRYLKIAEPYQQPVEFIDLAGCGYEEIQNPESLSLYNEGEIEVICRHLEELIPHLPVENPPVIAIISPYREQVMKIKEAMERFSDWHGKIKVNTVDSFQGQETDIVYISLVRSNENGEIGFLKDYRRMNVAMTRARKKLVIVGDSATLSNDRFYSSFLYFVQENAFYKSAWEIIFS